RRAPRPPPASPSASSAGAWASMKDAAVRRLSPPAWEAAARRATPAAPRRPAARTRRRCIGWGSGFQTMPRHSTARGAGTAGKRPRGLRAAPYRRRAEDGIGGEIGRRADLHRKSPVLIYAPKSRTVPSGRERGQIEKMRGRRPERLQRVLDGLPEGENEH